MAGLRGTRSTVDTSGQVAHARPMTAQDQQQAQDARAGPGCRIARGTGAQDQAVQAPPRGQDARVRLARRAEAGLLALLALDLAPVMAFHASGPFGTAGLLLVAGLAGTVVVERRAIDLAAARNAASEATLARMLRGLSRSDSADATVDAIVDDLREASGADHVVVARLKPSERIIEATLVSSSAAVPLSVTRFPASDLEPAEAFAIRARTAVSPGVTGPLRPARVMPLMPDGRSPGTDAAGDAAGAGGRGVRADRRSHAPRVHHVRRRTHHRPGEPRVRPPPHPRRAARRRWTRGRRPGAVASHRFRLAGREPAGPDVGRAGPLGRAGAGLRARGGAGPCRHRRADRHPQPRVLRGAGGDARSRVGAAPTTRWGS